MSSFVAKYLLYSQICVKQPPKGSTKIGCFKAGGCIMEVNISTKLKFGNILFGCFIEVTANSGLTVLYGGNT